MTTRRRWIRFAVGMVFALGFLALSLAGQFGTHEPQVVDYFLGMSPALSDPPPFERYVTPIPPTLLRRDPLRGRMQNLLHGDRFARARPLYLVVVAHVYADVVENVHLRLIQSSERLWQAELSCKTLRANPDPNADAPLQRVGVIATLGRCVPGEHRVKVTQPRGPEILESEIVFQVVEGTDGAPDHFMAENEFLQRGLQVDADGAREYLLTNALMRSLDLPVGRLLRQDPIEHWPERPETVSTKNCVWADEPWFQAGLVEWAARGTDLGVRTWAAFVLSYLAIDRPAYRSRLLECARAPLGRETIRVLATEGDLGALGPLLAWWKANSAEGGGGELFERLTSEVRRRGHLGAGRGVAPTETPPPWAEAAELLTGGAGPALPEGARRALLELLVARSPESNPCLERLLPAQLTPTELVLVGRSMGALPPEVPRGPWLARFAGVADSTARLEILRGFNRGREPAEPALGRIVSRWLEDPETRATRRDGGTFADEAAIALHRHAGADDADALAVAVGDDRLSWPVRTALALVLARIGTPAHVPVLVAMLAAGRSAGVPDLEGLERELRRLGGGD